MSHRREKYLPQQRNARLLTHRFRRSPCPGEPVRIVVAGYPPIEGATLLAKRRQARERLDAFRRLLMFEPRGHFDMYGVIPVASDPPKSGEPPADLAVLFMHIRHHP